jgi:hypothetical protein
MNEKGRDERERAVVQFWRRGHLSRGTIQVYISWVRGSEPTAFDES